MKNFGGELANEKFPLDKFCNVKNIVHLWGGKGGGLPFTYPEYIMIDIRLNSASRFGIGFEYRSKELHYYSMKRLDVNLLLVTISFIYTKFNI